jgi:formylglycine-generating enzyme
MLHPTYPVLFGALLTACLGLAGCDDANPAGDGGLDGLEADALDASDAADADDGAAEDDGPAEDDGATEDDGTPDSHSIGEPCAAPAECSYPDALCLLAGYPDGMCSLACDGLCPDSPDASDAFSACIEDPGTPGQGLCVARCDPAVWPPTGCRSGYACVMRPKLQADVVQPVCLPDDGVAECAGDEAPLPNAGLIEPPGQGGCPAGMAPGPGTTVCIDRWEAYLEEITKERPLPWPPYFNPGALRVRARSAPGAVPQGYISGLQAGGACAEAGKRLCTRTEWELVCRGSEGRTYPYGATRQDGLCNDARAVHPAVEYFGTSEDWIWSELDHACLNQLADGLALTGAHAGCATPEGVLDLMGNLHEWIDDPEGTFKGGFYVDTRLNGEGCLYTTTTHASSYWDYSTGFRCCAAAP